MRGKADCLPMKKKKLSKIVVISISNERSSIIIQERACVDRVHVGCLLTMKSHCLSFFFFFKKSRSDSYAQETFLSMMCTGVSRSSTGKPTILVCPGGKYQRSPNTLTTGIKPLSQ